MGEINYVVGFAFSQTMRSVVLIEKRKPEWQAGKLNGVGGKMEIVRSDFVEHLELPRDAMAREFLEETGVRTEGTDWLLFEVMRFHNGAVVHCFATRLPVGTPVTTMEEEPVDVYPVDCDGILSELETIPNLRWLIPKAFHQLREPPQERMIL